MRTKNKLFLYYAENVAGHSKKSRNFFYQATRCHIPERCDINFLFN